MSSKNMMILDEVYEKLTLIKGSKDSYSDVIQYLITRDEILDEVGLGLMGTVVMVDTRNKDEINFLLKLREGDELFEGVVKKFLVRFKDNIGLVSKIGIGDVAVVIGYTSTDLVICYDLKGKNGEMCPVLDAKYVINMKKAEGLGLSGLEKDIGTEKEVVV